MCVGRRMGIVRLLHDLNGDLEVVIMVKTPSDIIIFNFYFSITTSKKSIIIVIIITIYVYIYFVFYMLRNIN